MPERSYIRDEPQPELNLSSRRDQFVFLPLNSAGIQPVGPVGDISSRITWMMLISAAAWASKQTTTKWGRCYWLKVAAKSVKPEPSVLDVSLVCSAEIFRRLRMIKWHADEFTVHEHDMLTSQTQKEKLAFWGGCGLVCKSISQNAWLLIPSKIISL